MSYIKTFLSNLENFNNVTIVVSESLPFIETVYLQIILEAIKSRNKTVSVYMAETPEGWTKFLFSKFSTEYKTNIDQSQYVIEIENAGDNVRNVSYDIVNNSFKLFITPKQTPFNFDNVKFAKYTSFGSPFIFLGKDSLHRFRSKLVENEGILDFEKAPKLVFITSFGAQLTEDYHIDSGSIKDFIQYADPELVSSYFETLTSIIWQTLFKESLILGDSKSADIYLKLLQGSSGNIISSTEISNMDSSSKDVPLYKNLKDSFIHNKTGKLILFCVDNIDIVPRFIFSNEFVYSLFNKFTDIITVVIMVKIKESYNYIFVLSKEKLPEELQNYSLHGNNNRASGYIKKEYGELRNEILRLFKLEEGIKDQVAETKSEKMKTFIPESPDIDGSRIDFDNLIDQLEEFYN